MKNDKLIFIGTSVLLQKCIEITLKHYKNVFVITDDKQVKKIFKNKVKFIKINQIQKIKADYLFSVLNKKIINFDQIKTIKKISLNFHDGPLPRYAGLFSSSWAIYHDEKYHGVCWHKIDKSIDTGNIMVEKKFYINKNDTAYDIDIKGIAIGINLFKVLIKKLITENYSLKKQNLKKRSYFGRLKLQSLLKKFLKNKNNVILSRSFTLSPQKYEIIKKFFNIDFGKLRSLSNSTSKNNFKTNKLLKIFNKTFKLNLSLNSKNFKKFSLNNHPKWDSFTHVKLLSNIEKEFNISINEKNIDHFSNLELIFNYLSKKK